MGLFVVVSRLTDKGAQTLFRRPERVREVNRELEELGIKVLQQYLLLGEWDFLNIVEAPDEETLLAALVNLQMRGTVRTAAYPIVPAEEFIRVLGEKRRLIGWRPPGEDR